MTVVRAARFPLNVKYGLVGGPSFMTERVVTGAGYVKKNARWSAPLRKFKLDTQTISQNDWDDVLSFMHAVAFGGLNNFLVRDWTDYLASNENCSPVADGTTVTFQMYRTYVFGGFAYSRLIARPAVDLVPVTVFVNGTPASSSVYSIDATTGLITFTAPATTGAIISWSGAFDVPCEFDDDYAPGTVEDYNRINALAINMTEVRL